MKKQLKTVSKDTLKTVTAGTTLAISTLSPSLLASRDLFTYSRFQPIYKISGTIGHW